jgi:hypothetical protein
VASCSCLTRFSASRRWPEVAGVRESEFGRSAEEDIANVLGHRRSCARHDISSSLGAAVRRAIHVVEEHLHVLDLTLSPSTRLPHSTSLKKSCDWSMRTIWTAVRRSATLIPCVSSSSR